MSIEWAAGLFEGEGTVSTSFRKSSAFKSDAGRANLVLALKMTDQEIVERFASVMGCGYISEQHWYAVRGHKPQWRWQTKNLTEVETCIALLYPHMGSRRRARMDTMLIWLAAKRNRRRELGKQQRVRDALGRYE